MPGYDAIIQEAELAAMAQQSATGAEAIGALEWPMRKLRNRVKWVAWVAHCWA
jgi:hypothetical protein